MFLNSLESICQVLNPIAINNGITPFDAKTLADLVSLYDENRYHSIRIAKRGCWYSYRVISVPNKRLKELLRCEYIYLLPLFDLNESAFGFVKGRSVYDNALQHVRQKYVLNLDIHDFFSSTTSFVVVNALTKYSRQPMNKEMAAFFAESSCIINNGNPVLAQGSPLSPYLSNIVFIDLDKQINSLCKAKGIVYSRYADDMTFSSSKPLLNSDFISRISSILKQLHYSLNDKKTRIQKYDDRQMVTGLLVNEKVNVKRSFIKDIRNILYIWEKYGYVAATHRFQFAHSRKNGRYKPKLETCLRGKLAYLKLIKGADDPQYIRFSKKYKTLLDDLYANNPEYIGNGLAFGSFRHAYQLFDYYQAWNLIRRGECEDKEGNHYYQIGNYEKLLISPKLYEVIMRIKPDHEWYLRDHFVAIVNMARVTMLKQDQPYKWILWATPYEMKKMVWDAEKSYRKEGMYRYNFGHWTYAAFALGMAIKLGNARYFSQYLAARLECGDVSLSK